MARPAQYCGSPNSALEKGTFVTYPLPSVPTAAIGTIVVALRVSARVVVFLNDIIFYGMTVITQEQYYRVLSKTILFELSHYAPHIVICGRDERSIELSRLLHSFVKLRVFRQRLLWIVRDIESNIK